MSCARTAPRLSSYLEGDLSARQRERVRAHLASCAACSDELDALRRTVALLRSWDPEEPPAGFTERVTERVAREAGGVWTALGRWLERALSAPGVAPVAAAAVGVMAFGWIQSWDQRLAPGPVAELRSSGVPAMARIAGPTPLPAGVARTRVATAVPPQPAEASSRPSMAACVEGRPGGGPADPAGCAAWHAWFVGLALDDAPAFLDEVERLPTARRDPWLHEVSRFAASSGSAALIERELRGSQDPRASGLASRFERPGASRAPAHTPGVPSVRRVGFESR